MSIILSPSILNSDFSNLQREIEMLNQSTADWIHLDVMDGLFVPNITFGQPVVAVIKKLAQKPLDVHLMIVDPDRYIDEFQDAGANILTVQYEACTHLHRTVHHIKSKGIKAGVALNPHTPVELLKDIIKDVDMVLIMTVNPGFGAQQFIENSFSKIIRMKELIKSENSNALIEVDGGIDSGNIKNLSKAGADVFVVGSFIFKSKNPSQTISELKQT
jgi:ribulose-phosphate 3-epimerase